MKGASSSREAKLQTCDQHEKYCQYNINCHKIVGGPTHTGVYSERHGYN